MLLRMLPVLSLPAVLLVGCTSGEKDDAEDDPPPINTGDSAVETCEGTAPVVTDLVVSNGGIFEFEGVMAPSLKVAVTATDADSDLHRMDVQVWWDDVVDGGVDTSGAATHPGYIAMDEEPCATGEATYELIFQVEGTRFAYGTAYEFAGEAYDAAGLVSAQVVAHGVAPNADGTDG